MSEEVNRRAGDDDCDLPSRKHVGGVCDHELVADGRQHNPSSEDDVKIRVAIPG